MKPVKKEQTTPRRLSLATVALAAVLAASGAFCSCTKMEVELLPSHSKQITLSASMGTIGVETEAQSMAQTKAPVVDTEEQILYFARADETSPGSYSYATTAISATRPKGSGEQKLTFNPTQYYRTDKLKTKLTGWYPSGSYNSSARNVTWIINGQQDIMTAPKVEGSMLSPISENIRFTHHLAQLRFHPYAEDQATIDAWGKITKIEVLNQKNTVLYDLTSNENSGSVSFSGNATNTFSAGVATAGAAMSLSTTANRVDNAKQMGSAVMIVPQSSSSYELKLRITTEKSANKREVTITRAFAAGTPYRLYLCFKPLDITIEAAVANSWNDAYLDGQMLGNARVGDYYYTDGSVSPKLVSGKTVSGIVYDAYGTKFWVFSLDQGADLKWSAQQTYVLGAAGQNTEDGKVNVAAMKKYATDNGLTFSTAFPAAWFCDKKNTDGVTGWYLPAKYELNDFYSAYYHDNVGKNEEVLDAAITASGGTQMAIGGTGSRGFWASTEETQTQNAIFISFSNGATLAFSKDFSTGTYVRCIKKN